ncbi:MAG: type II secretion system F family protein [Actinomycetota bacterium]
MTELVLGTMAAASVWVALLPLVARDPVVARRVAALVSACPAGGEKPRASRRLLAVMGRRLPGDRRALDASLAAAGMADLGSDAFLGARALSAALATAVGLRFGMPGLLAAPALALAGWRLPPALVRMRTTARRAQLRAELPDAVELLMVSTLAGLSIPLALRRVASRRPGLLGEELQRTVREIDLGVPMRQALQRLAQRNDLDELRTFAATLADAQRQGTQVAARLQVVAGELWAGERHRAEEQARRAPVKMLFPLVFLILPAFVLLTVVPLLLATFRTLGF